MYFKETKPDTRHLTLGTREDVCVVHCTTMKIKTTHLESFSHPGLFIKLYLSPEGKPALPRPRRPEFLMVWMI
jgi:hypothetical protein